MARPRFHALATIPCALVAYGRWGRGVAIGVGVAGVLVDFDHLADYLWMRHRGHRRHFLAPLHAWELVVVGAVLSFLLLRRRQPCRPERPDGAARPRATLAALISATFDDAGAAEVVAGLTGGLTLHLVQDVLTNRPRHAGVYALGYRLRHGFDRHRIGWEAHNAFHAWTSKPWYTWI
jgi:hypothetical protein